MNYIKTTISIQPVDSVACEILIAGLSELGYDSFMDTDEGIEAYIPSEKYFPLTPEVLPFLSNSSYRFNISAEELEEKNWNEEWEKNYFKPIIIGKKCLVRSPFHDRPSQKTQFEILIEPRMAFGTGYHQTTSLMMEHLLEMKIEGQNVLDMGCGTGILGILASMLGASKVTGIDTDHWAVDNARDNLELNNIRNMEIELGDASLLKTKSSFNIILANINRNILMEDMPHYNHALKNKGYVLLSGFYKEDFEKIDNIARSLKWEHLLTKEQNNWMAVSYRKK
jgi:ribosomal protein L11 methyltransferase